MCTQTCTQDYTYSHAHICTSKHIPTHAHRTRVITSPEAIAIKFIMGNAVMSEGTPIRFPNISDPGMQQLEQSMFQTGKLVWRKAPGLPQQTVLPMSFASICHIFIHVCLCRAASSHSTAGRGDNAPKKSGRKSGIYMPLCGFCAALLSIKFAPQPQDARKHIS